MPSKRLHKRYLLTAGVDDKLLLYSCIFRTKEKTLNYILFL